MISLYDPASQVSKVVVVDATNKALYTGSIAQHPSSVVTNVDLPLVLHDHSEWVKLYDNKNMLVSVGQVGGFIESNGTSFEMDNNLIALGSYLVGKTIDASSNLAKDPMSALTVLAKNYESSGISDPYTMLGAKFVLLQQNGKSESEAVSEVIGMLDQYDQFVTPLPLDDKIIKIIENSNNPNTNSGTNSKLQATTLNNSKQLLGPNTDKSIDYDTLLTSRTNCYKKLSYNIKDSDMAACVTKAITKSNPAYAGAAYKKDLEKVAGDSNSFGAVASTGAMHVLSDSKTIEKVTAGIANVTGAKCSLKQDDISTMSTIFDGLDQVLSLAPSPINIIGSISSGVFKGICPARMTKDDAVAMSLARIEDELKQIDGKLDAIGTAIQENANKTWAKMDADQQVTAYKDYDDKFTTNYSSPLAVLKIKTKSALGLSDSQPFDLLDPLVPYQLMDADMSASTLDNTKIKTFLGDYAELAKKADQSEKTLKSLNAALATCQKSAISDSTTYGSSLDRNFNVCFIGYAKHAAKINTIVSKEYVLGTNIRNFVKNIESQTDQIMAFSPQRVESNGIITLTPWVDYVKQLNESSIPLGKKLLQMRWDLLGKSFGKSDIDGVKNKTITGLVAPYDTNYSASNLKAKLTLVAKSIHDAAHVIIKGTDSTGAKYYPSTMDYLYRSGLDGNQLATLDAIAKIPVCSTLYNGKTSANIVDYNIKLNTVNVKCGNALTSYVLNGSKPKFFADALIPDSVHVNDYDNHVSGDNKGTAWLTYSVSGNSVMQVASVRDVINFGVNYCTSLIPANKLAEKFTDVIGDYLKGTINSSLTEKFSVLGFQVESNIHTYALGYGQECVFDGTCGVINPRMEDMDKILLKQTPYLQVNFNKTFDQNNTTSTADAIGVPKDGNGLDVFSSLTRGSEGYKYLTNKAFGAISWTQKDIDNDVQLRAPYRGNSRIVYNPETGRYVDMYDSDNQWKLGPWLGYFISLTDDGYAPKNGYRSFLAYVKAPALCVSTYERATIRSTQRKEIIMVGKASNNVIHPFAMQYEMAYTLFTNGDTRAEHHARLVCLTDDCVSEAKGNVTASGDNNQNLKFNDGTVVRLTGYTATGDMLLQKYFGNIHGFKIDIK